MCNCSELTCNNIEADFFFKTSTFFLFSGCLLSGFANCLFLYAIWWAKLLHRNTRILFTHYVINGLFVTMVFLARVVYNVYTTFAGFQQKTARQSAVFELATMVPLFSLSLKNVALVAQRARASMKIALVEKQNTGFFVKLLITISWFSAVLLAVLVVVTAESNKVLCYSHFISIIKLQAFYIAIVVLFLSELTSLVVYVFLIRFNTTRLAVHALNVAQSSLLRRLQIWNNIKLTHSLVPALVLHSLCLFIFIFLSVPIYLYSYHSSNQIQAINLQMILFLPISFNVAMYPFSCVYRNRHLKRAMKEGFRKSMWWLFNRWLEPRFEVEARYQLRPAELQEQDYLERRGRTPSRNVVVPVVRDTMSGSDLLGPGPM